jgi:hypothetical protein
VQYLLSWIEASPFCQNTICAQVLNIHYPFLTTSVSPPPPDVWLCAHVRSCSHETHETHFLRPRCHGAPGGLMSPCYGEAGEEGPSLVIGDGCVNPRLRFQTHTLKAVHLLTPRRDPSATDCGANKVDIAMSVCLSAR